MVCPECGADNKPGARLCELCGRPLPTAREVTAPEATRRRTEAEERIARRRRQERVLLPVFGVVALGLLGLIVWRVMQIPKYLEQSRQQIVADYPVTAMDHYYKALEAGDYAGAYGLVSQEIRQRMPEAAFAQVYSSGQEPKPTSHKVKDTGEWDAEHLYMAVSVNGRPSYATMVRDPDGWRVEWTPPIGRLLSIPAPVTR